MNDRKFFKRSLDADMLQSKKCYEGTVRAHGMRIKALRFVVHAWNTIHGPARAKNYEIMHESQLDALSVQVARRTM